MIAAPHVLFSIIKMKRFCSDSYVHIPNATIYINDCKWLFSHRVLHNVKKNKLASEKQKKESAYRMKCWQTKQGFDGLNPLCLPHCSYIFIRRLSRAEGNQPMKQGCSWGLRTLANPSAAQLIRPPPPPANKEGVTEAILMLEHARD